MKLKSFCLLIFILLSLNSFAQDENDNQKHNTTIDLTALLIPALIAAAGYISKSLYDTIIDRQKAKHNLIEEKLKDFYWPILTRLEENNSIWELILHKRNEHDELKKSIAVYVENNIVLKNHRNIMDIIIKNRHLAKFDNNLTIALKKYFQHVAIYEGILTTNQKIFPGNIGAFYPNEFDKIITERTESLQKRLDKKII